MARIVGIKDEIISVGMDDGSLREVRFCDCNFVPEIGTKVEVFENQEKIVIHKLAEDKKTVTEQAKDGINISINNQNQNIAPNLSSPTYVQPGKVVQKWLYLVLCFFLGGIGIHKFYAGRIGTGVVYLLFCWTGVPYIISIVEFIIACFKPSDANGNIII